MWVASHGGLKSCCRIPRLGAPIYDAPPWMVMPQQGIVIRQPFQQPITAFQSEGVFSGTDVLLGQFNIETGYDGVLNNFVFAFNGSGFVDGAGSILWRVKIDQRYAKDLGNFDRTFGSFTDAFNIPWSGIRVISGQTISIYANVQENSPISGGFISGAVFGWTYPRR